MYPIQIHLKIQYVLIKTPILAASNTAGVCPQGGPVDLRLEVTTETGTQGGNGLHWSWRTGESGLVGIQRTTPHEVSGLHLGCTLVKAFFFLFSPEFPCFFWGFCLGEWFILCNSNVIVLCGIFGSCGKKTASWCWRCKIVLISSKPESPFF